MTDRRTVLLARQVQFARPTVSEVQHDWIRTSHIAHSHRGVARGFQTCAINVGNLEVPRVDSLKVGREGIDAVVSPMKPVRIAPTLRNRTKCVERRPEYCGAQRRTSRDSQFRRIDAPTHRRKRNQADQRSLAASFLLPATGLASPARSGAGTPAIARSRRPGPLATGRQRVEKNRPACAHTPSDPVDCLATAAEEQMRNPRRGMKTGPSNSFHEGVGLMNKATRLHDWSVVHGRVHHRYLSPRKRRPIPGPPAALLSPLSVLVPEHDPSARQVVGRHLNAHPIAGQHANPESAHVATERREDGMGLVHRHAERGVGEDLGDRPFELYRILFRHVRPGAPRASRRSTCAPLCTRHALPGCTGLALPRLAGLLVIPLPAKILEHARANHLALKLLECHVQTIVFTEYDFDHNTSRAEDTKHKDRPRFTPRSINRRPDDGQLPPILR